MLSSYKTTITADDSASVIVTYHKTQIVRVNKDGTITLNTGGYETLTTKKKMNQAAEQFGLGFKVWQRNHQWFVRRPDGSEVCLLSDSITFDATAAERDEWTGEESFPAMEDELFYMFD